MCTWQINSSLNVVSSCWGHSLSSYSCSRASLINPSCSLRFQEIPIESKSDEVSSFKTDQDPVPEPVRGSDDKGISGIRVPRQRYIPVSKSELLDAILTTFDSQQDVHEFLRFSSCLDSILHAEHKGILEELRIDYSPTHSIETHASVDEHSTISEEEIVGNGRFGSTERNESDEPLPFNYVPDLRFLLGSSAPTAKTNSRVAIATRFQRAFMKLLHDAQFEELSARDLMLTSSLNTDYLLTLPIYVDWKKASESNAIIFRRGYATERQKGLLIVEKLDYLQSKLLQGIFFILSKPLGKVGMWINEALKNASQTQEIQVWTKRLKPWFKEPFFTQQSYSQDEETFDNELGVDQLSDIDLPIWLAAQRAVSRYEGLLSSVGPRKRLLRKLLAWIGLIPSMPESSIDINSDSTASEPYLRPISLSRISLSDIWRPAMREPWGNDLWKMLKTAVSILFSQSILQEPAFQELILLYTEEMGQRETGDRVEVPSLQLKIYERIPIPDLPVIFPHKKLSFRILDTVRLDVATILGLLAYFVNYKFEDILSSPSAISPDVIAVSALVIYVTRVALGYKQTRDRYQLLVNRTLYEKTLASGFGSVHFLLDASEQQQYKEAILAYAFLLQSEKGQVTSRKSVGNSCERFMYDKFNKKVEMPIDKAIDTLLRLGLVTEVPFDGNVRLQTIPCPKAYDALKQRWNNFLG